MIYFHRTRERSRGKERRIVNICFIGEGGSGKTSTLNALLNRPFNEGEKLTVGLNVEVIKYEKDEGKYFLRIYDFGGQNQFREVVDVFIKKFGNNATYVLFIDLSQARMVAKIPEWRNYLENKGIKVSLIVGNKLDIKNGSTDFESIIKENFPGVPYIEISAKTKENVDELRNKLYELAEQI